MNQCVSPTNQLTHSLIPDYLDPKADDRTSSFVDIRQKTLRSLYGIEDENDRTKVNYKLLLDKSPKGSVDEGIRSLVDLVNAHPSFATLSSCSGRISLFDPNHHSRYKTGDDIPTKNVFDAVKEEGEQIQDINGSGKGYGAWLISSHAQIASKELIDALDCHAQSKKNDGYALMFKHEPLLLHIAASNIVRARQLLTIVYNLGFRESGLVVTNKRITVAIRSHSLSLCVPISSCGHLRPNNAYLSELVREANERFYLNKKKLKALELEIKNSLFQYEEQDDLDHMSFSITSDPLPDLNLWGHSAVVIPSDGDEPKQDVDVIAIGGYGMGPVIKGQNKKKSYHNSRSDKVLRLKRRNKQWESCWNELEHVVGNNACHVIQGIKTKQVSFIAREGHSSCILQLQPNKNGCKNLKSNVIATFGGRASPSRPFDELLLMTISKQSVKFLKPIDVRGEIPSPRWGHTFTALSGSNGRVALLIGGRNENSVLSSIYVLSYKSEQDFQKTKSTYFLWERIDITENIPRFLHSTVLLPRMTSDSYGNETVLLYGGLRSLALFGHDKCADNGGADQQKGHLFITIDKDNRASINHTDDGHSYYGGSTCLLTHSKLPKNKYLLMRVGGVPCYDTSEESELDLFYLNNDRELLMHKCSHMCDKYLNLVSSITSVMLDTPAIDDEFSIETVLIGGGVPLFAFGQSFAKSSSLTVSFQKKQRPTDHERSQKICNTKKGKVGMSSLQSNANNSDTYVVYVKNKNAKELKNALESLGCLDRRYRMTKADDSSPIENTIGLIAVPIIDEYHSISSEITADVSTSWTSLVEASGRQKMPFSTAVLGNK